MIVDPWGTVLSQCPDRDGYALASLDLDYLDRFREEFPALKNRRPEATTGRRYTAKTSLHLAALPIDWPSNHLSMKVCLKLHYQKGRSRRRG